MNDVPVVSNLRGSLRQLLHLCSAVSTPRPAKILLKQPPQNGHLTAPFC
jgi:hypothetical protein